MVTSQRQNGSIVSLISDGKWKISVKRGTFSKNVGNVNVIENLKREMYIPLEPISKEDISRL